MTENTEKKQQQDGLTLVLLRNAFYRDKYRRAAFALLFVLVIDIALVSTIVYRHLNPPQPQYFAINSQYQLIKWHPLSDPVFNNDYVLQWVSTAVQRAFSLDFVHWRQQLQDASVNFTDSGWHWFLSAFNKSGNLKTLVTLQMVSNASVTGAPEIQYQNVLNGTYVWKISIPILVTYSNMQRTINQPMQVTLIVQRVPVQDNPNRIAISQFLPVVEQA